MRDKNGKKGVGRGGRFREGGYFRACPTLPISQNSGRKMGVFQPKTQMSARIGCDRRMTAKMSVQRGLI